MGSVRVAIVGVGNCATSLIQGVEYYKDADPDGNVPGLMHVSFGDYHELDVGDVVIAEGHVHEAWHVAVGVGVLVVLDALDQGRRAVADAHDCYSNRTHGVPFLGVSGGGVSRGGCARRGGD